MTLDTRNETTMRILRNTRLRRITGDLALITAALTLIAAYGVILSAAF